MRNGRAWGAKEAAVLRCETWQVLQYLGATPMHTEHKVAFHTLLSFRLLNFHSRVEGELFVACFSTARSWALCDWA
jgi:hypothetical protein